MTKEVEFQIVNTNGYDLADKEFELEVGVNTSETVLYGPHDIEVNVDIPEGHSQQDGTPTPSNPVEIQSVADDVNILDESIVTEYENRGLKWKYDINTKKIKVTGTSTSTYSQSNTYSVNIPAGTYKFSVYTNSNLPFNMWLFNSSNQIIGNTKTNNPITVNETVTKIGLFCEQTVSGTEYDETINVKLQKGSTATPYSEYGKGTVTINQSGKNICSSTDLQDVQNIRFYFNKKDLEKNFTISFTTNETLISNSIYLSTDGTNTWLVGISGDANTRVSKTITLTDAQYELIENASFYHFRVYKSGANFTLPTDAQIENGNLTDYEPYFSQDYIIQTEPLRSLPNGVKDTIEEDGIHRRIRTLRLAVADMNNSEDYPGWQNVPYLRQDYPNKNTTFYWAGIKYLCNITTQITDSSQGTDGLSLNTNYQSTIFLPKSKYNLTQSQWIAQYPDLVVEIQYEMPEEVIEPIFDEYIPYGEYTVKQYEDLKSNNRYKVIAYDSMDKLNEEYLDNNEYPVTLKEFYKKFANFYGLDIAEQTLPNEDFVVNGPPILDNMTGRSILGCIAELFGSFAKINRNNEIQMYLKENTNEIFTLDDMNSKLEIDNMYGPVNVVTIGLSAVEGENVTLQDDASIAQYGETTIRIDDNPFVYTEDLRELVIQDLYDRLHNFSYIPVSFQHKARLYTDCGDGIQVQKMDESGYVDTLVLNQTIKIPRTRQSQLESKALTNTAQERKYISKTKQQNTRTEIVVDKLEQNIKALVEKSDEIVNQQEKFEIDINGITNTLTTAGGSNLLRFSTEYWELKYLPVFQEIIKNIGDFDDITESALNAAVVANQSSLGRATSILNYDNTKNYLRKDSDYKENITTNIDITSSSLNVSTGYKIEIQAKFYESENNLQILSAVNQAEIIYIVQNTILSFKPLYTYNGSVQIVEEISTDISEYIGDEQIHTIKCISNKDNIVIYIDGEEKEKYEIHYPEDIQEENKYIPNIGTDLYISSYNGSNKANLIYKEINIETYADNKTNIFDVDESGAWQKTGDCTSVISGHWERYLYEQEESNTIRFKYITNLYEVDEELNVKSEPRIETIKSDSIYYEDMKKNTISGLGYLLKNEYVLQKLTVPNGIYTISLLYKTFSEGLNTKLIIDTGVKSEPIEISLEDSENYTDTFIIGETEENYIVFEVTDNIINIGLESNSDNAVTISDLMLNLGNMKLDWSQNANETITDTVRIGKGIEIESTVDDVKFKADTDGIRIVDKDSEEVTSRFTRQGTETNNINIKNSAYINGLTFRRVGQEMWITFTP